MADIAPLWVMGSEGFLGDAITRAVAESGRRVVCLGHGFDARRVEDRPKVLGGIDGDVSIENLDLLHRRYGSPSSIVHVAGGSAVGPSLSAPYLDFQRTVYSTAALAEWVRVNAPFVPIAFASSGAVYGASHTSPILESSSPDPASPYGFSKDIAERTLRSYAHSFGLQVRVIRFFSVYGPGLRKQLLWDASNRLMSGGDLKFSGDGKEMRDWLYIDDAARIVTRCLDADLPNYFVVNGGSGVATSVQQILELLANNLNTPHRARFSLQPRLGDPRYLVADDRRLATDLSFTAEVSLSEGIAKYADWYVSQASEGQL